MLFFYSGSLHTLIVLVLVAINLIALLLGFYGVYKHKFKVLRITTLTGLVTLFISVVMYVGKHYTTTDTITALSLLIVYLLLFDYAGYINFKKHQHK